MRRKVLIWLLVLQIIPAAIYLLAFASAGYKSYGSDFNQIISLYYISLFLPNYLFLFIFYGKYFKEIVKEYKNLSLKDKIIQILFTFFFFWGIFLMYPFFLSVILTIVILIRNKSNQSENE